METFLTGLTTASSFEYYKFRGREIIPLNINNPAELKAAMKHKPSGYLFPYTAVAFDAQFPGMDLFHLDGIRGPRFKRPLCSGALKNALEARFAGQFIFTE